MYVIMFYNISLCSFLISFLISEVFSPTIMAPLYNSDQYEALLMLISGMLYSDVTIQTEVNYRVMWYFEEGDVVLRRGLCDTLNSVVWYFEEGDVLL